MMLRRSLFGFSRLAAVGLLGVLLVGLWFGSASCAFTQPDGDSVMSTIPVTSDPNLVPSMMPVETTTLTSITTSTSPVTRSVMVFVDTSRPTIARPPVPRSIKREFRTTIRHPAIGSGPWPLVVFGHGFNISTDAYSALLDTIAAAGFVVAAPEFPGSSTQLAGQPDEHDLQQEPCDLRFVASQLLGASGDGIGVVTDSVGTESMKGLVKAGRIGLVGQSDGATAAAFAVLGSDGCSVAPGVRAAIQPADISGVVAFSANPVPAAGITAAGRMAGSSLLAITGGADRVNVPAHTMELFASWPGPAWLLTSIGDGHLSPATDSIHAAAIDAVVIDFLRGTVAAELSLTDRITADASVDGLTLVSH
ncbi:MAG: hypothetical protein WCK41_12270 [Actinomycetes bacterium]